MTPGPPPTRQRPRAPAPRARRRGPASTCTCTTTSRDDELWDYLQSLDVSVLPYRFGTHSGWLEACHDLGHDGRGPRLRPLRRPAPVPALRRAGIRLCRTAAPRRCATPSCAPTATVRRGGPTRRSADASATRSRASHEQVYAAVLAAAARAGCGVRVVILAAAKHPIAEPFAGGLESLTWHLVRGLRGCGVDVTFFAGPGSDPALGATAARRRAAAPQRHGPARRVDGAGGVAARAPRLPAGHAGAPATRRRRRRAQQQPPPPPGRHGRLAAVARADDPPHPAHPVARARHRDRLPVAEPLRHSHFVAVSEHTARLVVARHLRRTSCTTASTSGRWVAGPGGDDLVWVGRIVPEKAPHRAIAMARAAGRRLRIAGPVGDAGYFARHVAGELGDGVDYVGHLDTDALVALVGTQRGHARDAGVGRALRPRRRGVARLRHAGRGPRPRRSARVRRARASVCCSRRDCDDAAAAEAVADSRRPRPRRLPRARRRRLLGGPHGRELPRPLRVALRTLSGAA